jgi:hypothetical protein
MKHKNPVKMVDSAVPSGLNMFNVPVPGVETPGYFHNVPSGHPKSRRDGLSIARRFNALSLLATDTLESGAGAPHSISRGIFERDFVNTPGLWSAALLRRFSRATFAKRWRMPRHLPILFLLLAGKDKRFNAGNISHRTESRMGRLIRSLRENREENGMRHGEGVPIFATAPIK